MLATWSGATRSTVARPASVMRTQASAPAPDSASRVIHPASCIRVTRRGMRPGWSALATPRLATSIPSGNSERTTRTTYSSNEILCFRRRSSSSLSTRSVAPISSARQPCWRWLSCQANAVVVSAEPECIITNHGSAGPARG